MKHLILVLFFVFSFANLKGQDAYQQSVGLRGGPLIGVSYKNFLWPLNGVIEGIAGFNYVNGRYLSLTGLYEHHLFINYSTNFFGGGGFTLGANRDKFFWQFDLIVGIEYIIDFMPVCVSIDYKPGFRILDGEFVFNEFGVSIRYILVK